MTDRYDAHGHTATVETPHLSIWTWFTTPVDALLGLVKTALTSFLGTKDQVQQPTAPRQASANSDGLQASSSNGSLVKWSLGESPASAGLLQVANNRHFAIELDYPNGWTVARDDWGDIDTHVVRAVAGLLTVPPRSHKAIVVPGGESVTFTVPAGTRGTVTATPSAPAYLTSAFLFGVQTLAMVMKGLPGAPSPETNKTVKAIDAVGSAHDCVLSDQDLAASNPTTITGAAALTRAYFDFAVGCLGGLWDEAYGLVGAVGSFVASVVLWLYDGVKLVIDGIDAAIETAVYWQGYSITVLVPQKPLRVQTVDSRTNGDLDGLTYTVKVWAHTETTHCAGTATGQIDAYMRSHYCRQVMRTLATTVVNGRTAVIAQAYIVFGSPPGYPVGRGNNPYPSYGYVDAFTKLAAKDGTGDVKSLLDEGYRFPGSGTETHFPNAFDAEGEDSGAEVIQTWYLNGNTPDNDPPLVHMAQQMYLNLF